LIKENEMTTHTAAIPHDTPLPPAIDRADKTIAYLGGAAALLVVLTVLVEILITFLPGGYTTAETVVEWFTLLQRSPFLGLRNLGLLNIIMNAFGIPLIFSLYWVHRKTSPSLAALALIVSMIGTAIFYATNRALPLFSLSAQWAAAPGAAERALLEAAGQAMLAVGQSHTAGTFLAFFFAEVGGIFMAVVMLRARLFNRAAACAGLIGFSFLLIFEVFSSFAPATHDAILILAMLGGLANISWYVLVAWRFLRLEKAI
jgi:hypothetical protein